jgi:hypothetical protein
MDCQEFKRLIDSYLGDELLVETNHDVLKHLEGCRDCREQLSAVRNLRGRLRDAVRTTPAMRISDAFAIGLASDLRKTALRPGILERLTAGSGFAGMRVAAIGFACLVVIVIGGFFLLRAPRNTAGVIGNNNIGEHETIVEANKTRLADAVKVAWKDLSAQAVGDHENCAVKFNLEEHPISLDEAAKKFGPFNKDIDKTIFEAAKTAFDDKPTSRIELLEAHFCIYAGRPFTHIVLRRQGKIISVLGTDTDLPPESEAPVTRHADGALNATGFSIGRHAFFVVSEMGAADNAQIARAIYPAMHRHIDEAGA